MFFQLSKSLFYRVVQVFLYVVFLAICLMSIKYYMEFYNAKIESQIQENSGDFQKSIENEDLGLEGQVKRIAADPSHRQTKQSDFLGKLLTSGGFLG